MPSISSTEIAGTDRANQIDEKVMSAIAAVWGMITDSGDPSSSTVTISNHLLEDLSGISSLGVLRLVGNDEEQGVRIHTSGGDEYWIYVSEDCTLFGSDAQSSIVFSKRTDGGSIDGGTPAYTPVCAINEDGIFHVDAEIGDLATRLSDIDDDIDANGVLIAANAASISAIGEPNVLTNGGIGIDVSNNFFIDPTNFENSPPNTGDVIEYDGAKADWATPALAAHYAAKFDDATVSVPASQNYLLTLADHSGAGVPAAIVRGGIQISSGQFDVAATGVYEVVAFVTLKNVQWTGSNTFDNIIMRITHDTTTWASDGFSIIELAAGQGLGICGLVEVTDTNEGIGIWVQNVTAAAQDLTCVLTGTATIKRIS